MTYPPGTASGYPDYTNNANMVLPVQSALDQINLQTYGMAGPFPGWVTWFNSPLHPGACVFPGGMQPPPSVDSTVRAFTAAGVSKARLGIGIQLVGIDWVGGDGTSTGGPSQPCQAWTTDPANNLVNASDIIRNYTAANGYTTTFHDAAMLPWLSKDLAGSANDHFVSFENVQSIQAKGDYLKTEGLGGAIVFEVSQDYLVENPAGDAQHPLMAAVRQYVMR